MQRSYTPEVEEALTRLLSLNHRGSLSHRRTLNLAAFLILGADVVMPRTFWYERQKELRELGIDLPAQSFLENSPD